MSLFWWVVCFLFVVAFMAGCVNAIIDAAFAARKRREQEREIARKFSRLSQEDFDAAYRLLRKV